MISIPDIVPTGCRWTNNSCAYDALFFILYNMWLTDPIYFTANFHSLNSEWLGLISETFQKHLCKEYTLEQVRDYIRCKLCNAYPNHFTFGHNTSVEGLISKIFTSQVVFNKSYRICSNDHQSHFVESFNCSLYPGGTGNMQWTTIQDFFNVCDNRPLPDPCVLCDSQMKKIDKIVHAPVLIAVIVSRTLTPADHALYININNSITQYNLCGIIYYGGEHFTARYIDRQQTVWFNDGVRTGHSSIKEGDIHQVDLIKCPDNRDAELYIYAKAVV
ncbi:hypothetical protein EV421DRAFT_1722045 [Armillaria borealis]|uniref:USP domain-containing protein n=1 Tax=Armillaria borealis TaxID=47425 RepID=A0AA39ME11_9AGAR|nr:hypothetical protein EV421DRAFT_1722045 [Armillaria borealis]